MSDATTKASAYPTIFNLLLIALVPVCFVVALLSLIAALPIGELPYRIAAASLVALFPPLLALRASAGMKRRRLRGLLRAPIAIALMLLGYAAMVGGLVQWRGLEPPHLIAVADHLHRVYLLGETPQELKTIEKKLSLHEIYDRTLPALPPEEQAILMASTKPGVDGIEIWSTGDFRARFIGLAARTQQLEFIDDHRLLVVHSTGSLMMIDAEKTEVERTIFPPELLTEVQVQTSSNAAVIAGKTANGERAIHYFQLDTGALKSSLHGPYAAFAITGDLQRALIVEATKKGELLLTAYDLPSGQLEANLPKAVLTDAKGRKLKEVSNLVPIGGGEQALVFQGTNALIWDLKKKKKELPFALTKTKLYPYGVAPGGLAYFHRRTDAGDPNPTGLYRLPSGEKLIELPTRGQPPVVYFAPDGRSLVVGTAVFSIDGKLIGGRMPDAFTLDRERFTKPARDGSAFLEPDGKDRLFVRDAKLATKGVVPLRGEEAGVVSVSGKLYAVPVHYPPDRWMGELKALDEWHPPPAG